MNSKTGILKKIRTAVKKSCSESFSSFLFSWRGSGFIRVTAKISAVALAAAVIPSGVFSGNTQKAHASRNVETVVATLPPSEQNVTPAPSGTASGPSAAGSTSSPAAVSGHRENTATKEGVSIRFVKWKKVKKLKDGTVYEKLVYFKPVVRIPGNTRAQNKLNSSVNEKFKAFKQKAREARKEAKKYARRNPEGKPYSFKMKFAKQRCDSKVLVFCGTLRSFMGGESAGLSSCDMNFDVHTGDLLTLKNISNKPDKFGKLIRKKVIRKCEKKYSGKLNVNYRDALDRSVICDGNWYFDTKGIVFVADENSIAPYSQGTFVFSIKYGKLKYLKKEYKL